MNISFSDEQFALVIRAINKEITVLKKLKGDMVGGLYPQIVGAEIQNLSVVAEALQIAHFNCRVSKQQATASSANTYDAGCCWCYGHGDVPKCANCGKPR